jgi:hypothetical protein
VCGKEAEIIDDEKPKKDRYKRLFSEDLPAGGTNINLAFFPKEANAFSTVLSAFF